MLRRIHTVAATSVLAVGLSSIGCAREGLDAGDAVQPLEEGTPEAHGVLALLNEPCTTRYVLDVNAGLDKRAAANLVAHRDGPDGVPGTFDDDLFDTIAEVDSVAWVGSSALGKLLDYAIANGWVEGSEDVIGVYDGVPFTAAEADATLDLANTASQAELDDDVGLDRRAAANIVAARPIPSLLELSAVSYVGESALSKMKAYAVD